MLYIQRCPQGHISNYHKINKDNTISDHQLVRDTLIIIEAVNTPTKNMSNPESRNF